MNLFGDPFNLQGNNQNLQGGPVLLQGGVNPQNAANVYGPRPAAPAPARTAAPVRRAAAAPRPAPVQTAPSVYFYKPDPNSEQVYDAAGNPLSYDQYLAAGGRPDWSNVLHQPIPGQVTAAAAPSMNTGSPTYEIPLDPNQQLAQSAGASGLTYDDYIKILSGQSGASEEEQNAIRQQLGIDKLENQVFSPPAQSTQQLYTDAYSSAGLADLKKQIDTKIAEVNKARKDYTDASGVVNENPFLSEASRVGRVSRLSDKAEAQIGNLNNELAQLQDLYNAGINEVSNLVTRQTADFSANQQLNTQKLQYLLGKAEQQIAAKQNEKLSTAYKYLPAFLQAKAKAQKPDTIGSVESGYYRWNPATATFEQVIAPKVEDKSLDNAYKLLQIEKLKKEIAGGGDANELLSANDAQTLGVPYGTTKGQAASMKITPQKQATDAQNQAAGYALRVNQSGNILDQLESSINGYNAAGFEAQMRLPSYLQSGTIQSYNQAARNFINAQLRRESGAAISQSEFDNAYQQYLPRPGDSAQVLAQKKQNRDAVLRGLINSSGPAYETLTGSSGKNSANPSDPLGLFKEKGGGVVGAISQKYPDGYNGGECGTFAHQLVSFPPVGDSKTEKIAAVQKFGIPADQWRNNVRVGDVIITGENPTYGHVAVVNAVLPNGKVQLSESNFKQSRKVSNDRVISVSSPQIYGAIRGTLKIA